MEYKLYFEFFGYKLTTTVVADSKEDAKEIVKNKIIFYDNVKQGVRRDYNNLLDSMDAVESLKNIFGMK